MKVSCGRVVLGLMRAKNEMMAAIKLNTGTIRFHIQYKFKGLEVVSIDGERKG